MKRFLIIFAYLPLILNAQITEQFTDGDFTYNPKWVGDTVVFKIETSTTSLPASMVPSLRLKNDTATSGNTYYSYLSTVNNMAISDSAEWQFWVKLALNPSSSNNGRFYLVSNQQNVTGSLNGYYVGIGEQSDVLTFCRQNGNTVTTLITGSVTNLNNSNNTVRIKVKKSATGIWELYSDATGGSNFVLEGTATDNTITATNWLGFYCKYTSSNKDKWYFDDIYAGSIQIDTIPPVVISLKCYNYLIDVKFSENVDPASAVVPTNYHVDNGVGIPDYVAIDAIDASLVHLSFSYPFAPSSLYNMTICNVKDIAGNIMTCDTIPFAFYLPQSFDVLINEIMYDPDPPVQLPNVEYIELYNRSNFPVTITNWKLYFGSTYKIIPAYTIAPDGYVILSYGNAMDVYGDNIPIFTSSNSLTSSGTTIKLVNESGQIIHQVTYSSNWFTDSYKANGGWSLELIDPYNPCDETSNWKASVDHRGGTPGSVNSVKANNPDVIPPKLLRAGVRPSQLDRVIVYFSEPLDSASIVNRWKYSISNGIGMPSSVIPIGPKYSSATIVLPVNVLIQNDVIYTLTVTDSVKDCAGNFIPVNSKVRFAVPDSANYNDVIINEILSYPPDGGSDYVEVYNKSNKIIDLGSLVLASYDSLLNKVINQINISNDIYLIFPGDYYCLTTNPDAIKKLYYTPNPDSFVNMSSTPSYNNDNGIVVISDKNNKIIDKLTYDKTMHFPLLKSYKGVSLERISFNAPTEDRTNWHSASETCGFGTPAYKNSQYSEFLSVDDPISINPEIFSPDNDGYNDVLGILYKFKDPGYVANITIYDSKGRQIKSLVKNALLGTEGNYIWDGITDDNERANIGIYIVYVEVFDLQGKTKHYKKTAVLGSKFN